jgi:hypothetical protein
MVFDVDGARTAKQAENHPLPVVSVVVQLQISQAESCRLRARRGKAIAGACSFCGKLGGAGLRLIAGPGVFCAECVGLCTEILTQDPAAAGELGSGT